MNIQDKMTIATEIVLYVTVAGIVVYAAMRYLA